MKYQLTEEFVKELKTWEPFNISYWTNGLEKTYCRLYSSLRLDRKFYDYLYNNNYTAEEYDHWLNPHLSQDSYFHDSGGWHMDTGGRYDYIFMLLTNASWIEFSNTSISGPPEWPLKPRLIVKPWTMYWIRRDIIHRPPKFYGDSPRIILRWRLEDI